MNNTNSPKPTDFSNDNICFGDFLICGFKGTKLETEEREFLSRIRPQGILLFEKNFDFARPYLEWLETLKVLLQDIKEATKRDDLIVTIDHEGGRVIRVPAPINRFPYAVQFQEKSREIGYTMGVELKSIGVNLSFAPCVDVNSNPDNPVIGPRAFGDNISSVSKYSLEYLTGLREAGVLGCGKHFPGHGDTKTDSHLTLPVLDMTMDELKTRELPPFQDLCDADVAMVMTAHILFKSIDSKEPVTFSSKFLKSLIRDDMGYKGVVISDDLNMAAVQKKFTDSSKCKDSIKDAFNAGNDMFIIGRHHNSETITESISNSFSELIESGCISKERLLEAKTRVKELTAKCHQELPTALSATKLKDHANLVVEATY